MSLFFESIKIENRKPTNLSFHNERFNKTRRDVLKISNEINLKDVISVQDNLKNTIYKCRVFYDYEIHKVEFIEYVKKNISKLIIVHANLISYRYKYTDRSVIERLKRDNTKHKEEEILIVKNGLITDTSYSNVCFYDGIRWVTPIEPLLYGTQRSKLLKEKRIFEKEIWISDLPFYKQIKLINAMIDFDEANSIAINKIEF